MNNHYCPDFQNKYIIEYQNRIRSLPLIRNDTFVHLYLTILEFVCIFRNFNHSAKIGFRYMSHAIERDMAALP